MELDMTSIITTPPAGRSPKQPWPTRFLAWVCRRRSRRGHHMEALGGPPEEIGHKVAAALVGTFSESFSVTDESARFAAIWPNRRDEHAYYTSCAFS